MNASKKTLVYLFMGLATLASVVPFIWMLVTSLKTRAEHSDPADAAAGASQPAGLRPGDARNPVRRFYLNSLLATFFTVTLQMAIATPLPMVSRACISRPRRGVPGVRVDPDGARPRF